MSDAEFESGSDKGGSDEGGGQQRQESVGKAEQNGAPQGDLETGGEDPLPLPDRLEVPRKPRWHRR